MLRDLKSNIIPVQAVIPQVAAATVTGTTIDTLGFDSAIAEVSWGAIVGAGDFVAKLQHGDASDASDMADLAAADKQGSFAATALTSTIERVGYVGTKRYIRVVITKTGGTSIAVSANIVKGHARLKP